VLNHMSSACADYLEVVLKPPFAKIIADNTATFIEQNINRSSYDCIVFRGISGALIAPIVAYKLGKPCVPVRKGEGTHSAHNVERVGGYYKYIILDDLISKGDTCREILRVCSGHSMKCTGIVLYNARVYTQHRPTIPVEETYMQPPEENLFFPDKFKPDLSYQVYCVGSALTQCYMKK